MSYTEIADRPEEKASSRSLAQFREAWESLPVPTPFQAYAWAEACAHTFGYKEVRVVTDCNRRVTGIAVFNECPGMKGLRTIGSKLWELEDFAYVDALAARQLAKTVLDCNRYVYLHNVASESPTITAFRQEATNHRIVLTRSRPGAPWLQLDTSWKEPESKLNSGRRSDLRRARRHAEKVGRVRLEFKRPTLNELDDLLDVAFQVETANWKGRISSSLSTNRDVGAFYRYYSRLLCEKRCLHLGFMWIGDRAAAMQLAVEHRNCFWLLKMGLDEEYSHTSPGTQLMVESLRYATDLGCEAYEFQGKIEAWNQIWTHTAHSRVSIRIYPPGIRGVCRFIEDGFHYVTRSMHCTEQNI